jgi:capsular polysaccharide biosynthesis protein
MPRLVGPLRPYFPVIKKGVLISTQLAGRVTRPGSTIFGSSALPARAAVTTPDYVRAHPEAGIEVIDILPALPVARTLPEGLPPAHWSFAGGASARTPPAFVAVIPSGRATGHYGAVITADNSILFDLSPYFRVSVPTQHPIFLRARLPSLERFAGTVAVLTTRGSDNYYHFLTDVLPRIVLVEKSGISIDRYLVNRSLPFQRDLLERFGISGDRVIESRAHPHIQAERLVVPTLPDPDMETPGWIVTALRDRLLPPGAVAPRRRIYVGRGSRRHDRIVVNEPDVLAVLARRGITPLDPGRLPVADQIQAFASAELIVAPHGAALTNLAFCSPGARLVELFAPDYVNVCFWALATHVDGLEYRYVIGHGPPGPAGKAMMAVSSDIEVDIGRLEAVLDALDAPDAPDAPDAL